MAIHWFTRRAHAYGKMQDFWPPNIDQKSNFGSIHDINENHGPNLIQVFICHTTVAHFTESVLVVNSWLARTQLCTQEHPVGKEQKSSEGGGV